MMATVHLAVVIECHRSCGVSVLASITMSTVQGLRTVKVRCFVQLSTTHVRDGLVEINHVMSILITVRMDTFVLKSMERQLYVMSYTL